MADTIEPQYSLLDSFGQSHFSGMTANVPFIAKTFSQMVSSDDIEKSFTDVCEAILNDREGDVNLNIFNNIVFNFTNADPQGLNMVVFNLLTDQVKDFSNWVQESLDQKKFGLQEFIKKYQDFYRRTQKLNHCMWYANNKNVRIGFNKKEYSNFNLMRSYLFYVNVINKKYTYEDGAEESFLYNIFSKCLEGDTSIVDVLPLFKMFSYYKNLSHVPKENKEELFNMELNDMFLTTMGSHQEFVKSMVAYVFKNIKEMKGDSINKTVYNINKLPQQFNERGIYNIYFIKYMENFLLSSNVTKEQLGELKKLVKDFSRPDDNQVIQELLYKIEDIEESTKYRTLYRNAHINTSSDKYKKINVDVNNLDRGIINPIVTRYYAWNDAKTLDHDEFDLSNSGNHLEIYVTMYNSLYSSLHPNRELQWNLNLSMGVVEVELGGKGGRKYQFQLTTPQMLVLCKFNNKSKLTAHELAEDLGIKLSKLGPILNSFLVAKVLTRSDNTADDKNMYISLNENFYSDNDKISLIPLMIVQQKKASMGQNVDAIVDKQVTDKFAIGRTNLLQACVVRVLKQHTELSYESLYENVIENLPFDLNEEMLDECINELIRKVYIKGDDPTSVSGESIYSYCVVEADDVKPESTNYDDSDEDEPDYSDSD